MKESKRTIALHIVKFFNVLMIIAPFLICWWGYYMPRINLHFGGTRNVAMIFLFLVTYVVMGKAYESFLISYYRISEMFYSQMITILVTDTLLFILLWILVGRFPNILPALGALAAQFLLSMIWCVAAHKWYFHTFTPQRSAIIYDEREGMEKLIEEYDLAKKYAVEKTAQISECLKNLSMLDDVHTVFLSGIHSHDRNIVLKYCIANKIRVLVIPRIGDVLMSGAVKIHLFHLPMLRVEHYRPSPEFLITKRALDIVISLFVLLLMSPTMLITAAAIKMEDHGPVFYRQTRLTKDERVFQVIKFRSMRVDAEKDGVARLSTGDKDDRITKVGHFIRRTRIDELPQLFNVLQGAMSLVGPRPERPEIAAQYEKEIPEFHLRLQAKAGLTGYAQVYGKYNTTPYDKLQMDLMYIANPSIRIDIMIFLSTIKILFTPESTEGIEAGKTNAMEYGKGTEEIAADDSEMTEI